MSAKIHIVPKTNAEPAASSDVERRRAEGLARIARFVGGLQDKGLYGKVTISLQNGVVTDLRLEQVVKADDL